MDEFGEVGLFAGPLETREARDRWNLANQQHEANVAARLVRVRRWDIIAASILGFTLIVPFILIGIVSRTVYRDQIEAASYFVVYIAIVWVAMALAAAADREGHLVPYPDHPLAPEIRMFPPVRMRK